VAIVAAFIAVQVWASAREHDRGHASGFHRRIRSHFDHTPVISDAFDSPQAVTRACLSCHPKAADVMHTSHFTWLGGEVHVAGHDGPMRIGKKNLLNNFCISIRGNEGSCTSCHAGYGWQDESFDFSRADNVDCLVCHEHTNTYVKGVAGLPKSEVDLLASARSVGTPSRENCLGCHAFGGGGQGVKHGDLDSSLNHPGGDEDIHIGRLGFLCVDCHKAPGHDIQGRSFSVSVEDSHGIACTSCHDEPEHEDARINGHLRSVACQTCHIPTYAQKIPTKAFWDWSKAGDSTRADDPRKYLKIKGEFVYEQDVVPEYRWFDGSVDRYLLGDRIDPGRVTPINSPHGDIRDKNARIWPFKVHRAMQPYDTERQALLSPITGGKDGYWTNFDWDNAFRLGSVATKQPYSGHYAFAKTEMYWPINHMVSPKSRALECTDCHGDTSRLDWLVLGYPGDPIMTGARP
jgi:octaheme c-type cytochrome (tetrathionate reductase family)